MGAARRLLDPNPMRIRAFVSLCLALIAPTLAIAPAHAQSPGFTLEAVESRPADPGVDLVVERLLPLQPGDPLEPQLLVELRR